MKNVLPRAAFLIVLFLGCFLLAFFFRKFGNVSANQSQMQFQKDDYDLAEKPLFPEGEVDVLKRFDEQRTFLIQEVIQSVVCISTEGLLRRRFQSQGLIREQLTPVKDIGSGVVVSKQGHIVTNHHVIVGKSRFVITMHNGAEYDAVLVGTDPSLDIAVLKIKSDSVEFQPMPFGDSNEVKVGQTVFAVGNPFGLGETVTQGIISAKERTFSDQQGDLFQTDAAINPGSSGGPLVSVSGEIIGINVAVFSSQNNQRDSQGVGFSIPANEVKRSFQQIADRGRPIRGFLGVELSDLTPYVKVYLNYKESGVAVTGVKEGSPAEKAGLKPRDVITMYDGHRVNSRGRLIRHIQNSPVDRKVDVIVWREGEEHRLNAMVLDASSIESTPQNTIQDQEYAEVLRRAASIGLKVREPEWIEKKSGGDIGVIISEVQQGSMAAQIKLRQNDRVLSMNDTPLITDAESSGIDKFYKFIKNAKPGEVMTMLVRRGNQTVSLKFSFKES